jgi:puromycin-sensitive aminopeptidase
MRTVPLLAWLLAVLAPLPAAAERLPRTVVPERYQLAFSIDLKGERFSGEETIHVRMAESTSRVVLNAAELALRDVTIAAAGSRQQAKVTTDQAGETATLVVPRPIGPGEADIRIRFSGALNSRLRGLYLSKTARRNYAVTQFEATDARRAFPCFDEPSFKATFDVAVTVDRGDIAISNGSVLSDTPGPGAAQHTVKFTTSPKMSSYLVAIAVGDFQCLEATEDRVPIRVCATPDKVNLGRIALESSRSILRFYNGYYTIKYPFGKLDLLAVPDFAAGAMENTAAIFFRETELLAETNTASLATRKNIADVIAHEMAHQWFGDLVTMAWWDDLWLNEGFATWMSAHPLADWKPEWHIPVDAAEDNQRALGLDSLASTHPIHTTAESPAEIEGSFDTITYQKGAAILRMVEGYVGSDAFRRAINAYLQAHAYGNATSEDLWTAVASASGRPVDRIMPAFIRQPGVPLVELTSMACNASKTETIATFRQSRFTLDPAAPPDNQLWQIPITYSAGAARATDAAPGSFVLSDRSQTQAVARGCVPWIFANAGASGYYRTAYPRGVLRAMAPEVLSALTAPERLSLVEDQWALVNAGRQEVADFLTLAAGFGREQTSGVLSLVTSRLGFIHRYLTTAASGPHFEAFVRTELRPSLDSLGVEGGPDDSDDRRTLRATLVSALGITGADQDVASRARTAVDRALRGGQPLDPTEAGALVAVAATHGDRALFDALAGAAERAASPEEHYRYLNALPRFRDPALVERALEETRSRLRSQDTAGYLARFFDNPAARDRAWTFVKTSWSDIEPKIKVAFGEGRVVSALGSFCDARNRDDIRAFFTAHPLPTAARNLRETLERIDNCIALRQKQTPRVTEWLSAR